MNYKVPLIPPPPPKLGLFQNLVLLLWENGLIRKIGWFQIFDITADHVQNRMTKWIFPKSHIVWKMFPDSKQNIRESADLHSVLYKKVWGSVRNKSIEKCANIG